MDEGPEGEELAEETSSERAVAAKPAAMRVRVELIGPFEDGAPLREALAITTHPEPVRSLTHDLLRHRRNEGLTKYDHQQPDLLIELVGEVAAVRPFDLDQPGDIESVGQEVVDRAAAIAARILPLLGQRTLPRPLRLRERPLALPSLLASARYRRLLEDRTGDDARVVDRAVAELGRRQAVWTAMTAMSAAVDEGDADRDIKTQAWSEATEAIWNPFIEVVVRGEMTDAPIQPAVPSAEDPDELVQPVDVLDQEDNPELVEAALADRAQRAASGIAGILERHARTVAADFGAPSDDLLAFVKVALHRYRLRLTSGYQQRWKHHHVIGIEDLGKDQDHYPELGVEGGQEAIDGDLLESIEALLRSIGRHADGADDTGEQMVLVFDVVAHALDDPSHAPAWLDRYYRSVAAVDPEDGGTFWSLHQATYPHLVESSNGSGVSDRQKKAMERIRKTLWERAARSRLGEDG